MENKQVNNQEKPFDDKRGITEPKYVTIDEMSMLKFDTDFLSRYMGQNFYGGHTQINKNRSAINTSSDEHTKETPEEWIWVDGYKGTDRDMKCMCDYQYELGKQFDMPDDAEIVDCSSGFHLCLNMDDVLKYKAIRDSNRFFRVHALVRKKDFEAYGKTQRAWGRPRNKLVAKSIVFVRELTNDEVLKCTDTEGWSEQDKIDAREYGINFIKDRRHAATLVALGYSKAFAEYIVSEGHYQAAYVAGTQKDLSMDMKVAYIMRNEY